MTAVPLLALLVDRWAGEPFAHVHPVVWMGRYLDGCAARRRTDAPRARQRVTGGVGVAVGCALAGAGAALLRRCLRPLPPLARVLAEAAVLSTLLAERMLADEIAGVGRTVGRDLDGARSRLAMLVSRDVADLDHAQVREAAIESLAENASDSIVAPLWWYGLAGLPGAAVYRFVNTADAMWGYRTESWRWWGAAAARADDVANWLPARATAVLLAPTRDLRRVASAASVTASPNAGWPMAAVAVRWDLRLRKPGVYVVNPTGRTPGDADVDRAITAIRAAATAAAIGASVCGRPAR
ncbi:MAG: adenosylcobinamide-phosphate synthase CbiB [Actinobacteria bacterium]|nr:adenosylcobinamide-phosphate synthase CbiB [Actinomycetota bacterium]